MSLNKFNHFFKTLSAIICASAVTAAAIFPCVSLGIDYMAEQEARKLLPVESNEIPDWPEGPAVGAKSAILMEMNTHTILYAKNIHEKMYPASVTKILTSLLAMQNCDLDEKVVFSHDAIYDVPPDGARLGGVNEGDSISLENALYSVLVLSANDVASAVGEHVAEKLGRESSAEGFAEIMNEKAKELGCTDSHFANANGLFDENHYTSAHDLALIGCEFFSNELLCKMSSTPRYHFKLKPSDEDDAWFSSKNELLSGKLYEYEYLLGSKTGFVSQSRQTLVSAAEKDGMKLVCVVLMEERPYQYEDTLALFQYGFENFHRISIDDNETKYNVESIDLFEADSDIFGDSTPLISMESGKYVILPNTAEFSDTKSELTYQSADADKESNVIATVNYSYSDIPVGSCNIVFTKNSVNAFSFSTAESAPPDESVDKDAAPNAEFQADGSTETGNKSEGGSETESQAATETDSSLAKPDDTSDKESNGADSQKVIFINVKRVIAGVLIGAGAILLIIFIISTINSYSFSPRGQSSKRIRKRKHENRVAKRAAKRTARWQKRQERKRRRQIKRRRY